jgi:hypothetical protein
MLYPKWLVNGIYLWCIPSLILFSFVGITSLDHGYYIGAVLYAFLAFVSGFLLVAIPSKKYPDVVLQYVYRDVIRFPQTSIAIHYEYLPQGEYVYLLQDTDVTGFCKIGYSIS